MVIILIKSPFKLRDLFFFGYLKKSIMSSITTTTIDHAYETAMTNGGKGAKLLGAGQGGFLLVYAEEKDQKRLIKSMNTQWTKFKIDNQGSVIIYDDS